MLKIRKIRKIRKTIMKLRLRRATPLLAGVGLLVGVSVISIATSAETLDSKSAVKTTARLVLYTARNEALIKPVLDAYTKETGVAIEFLTDKEGPLLERISREGKRSPADILMTVDAGNLWLAAKQEVLEPVKSKVLEANIPSHLRDPENRWFGFSVRSRTAVYNNKKVVPTDLTTYEALGSEKWKGRLCLRTSKKVYNQSLVAMLIAEHGEAKAEEIVRSWVKNLATDVFSDDTQVLRAIVAGQCDVGLVNTYYFGRLMRDEPTLPLSIFWLNQSTIGVHVNVSGAGLVKHSKNKKEAIRFLEWLSMDKAQSLFASLNLEYPASEKAVPDRIVAAWGTFKPNQINLTRVGELQTLANQVMDRVGYK